jgi:hypothetical protein
MMPPYEMDQLNPSQREAGSYKETIWKAEASYKCLSRVHEPWQFFAGLEMLVAFDFIRE